ncbi:S-layer homology domain-containing protein [Paenibacillus chondroitinus]|uniref:S-layer homology domain-containing protein n=1 Tax=Paenibacillus chondroitinus TaxID=59842 RepID=A0ABU6D7W0_9BACL|nr:MULTISPECIES: S-layer homology domain-containing protein [Paenibacillus]MCY9661742.1 S-layer homology domain-containing protein [Paenibacillus anseongense]MEB4793827.1 S-layer homology domain-containing protein [Paenibacillus chondroitinus]
MARLLLGLTLSLCLAIGLWLPQVAAASVDPVFSVTTSTNSLLQNQTVKVDIQGDSLNDLFAYELNLYYDGSILQPDTTQKFTDLNGFALPIKIVQEGGTHVQLVYTKTGSLTGLSGSVKLGTLTFRAVGTGTVDLTLEQVKISTSSLKEEKLITPNAKATLLVDSRERPTLGSYPTPTVSTPAEPNVVSVKPEQLQTSGTEQIDISLPTGAQQILLPSNTAELLGDKKLEIQAEKLKLELPAKVFSQLINLVSEPERSDSKITLAIEPLTESAVGESVLNQAKNQLGARVKLGSLIYNIKLYVTTKAGQTMSVTSFEQPVQIQFKLDSAVDPKLSSVYYISDNGGLERVGGTYFSGDLSSDISHFSKYTVLEVSKSFADVPQSHWAADVIQALASKLIISGTSEQNFEPESKVTRAQFTALMARALKLKMTNSTTSFQDVQSSDWFAPEVAAAVQAGIVNGRETDKFEPNALVSREEMTAILMRSYSLLHGKTDPAAASSFSDEAAIGEWALADVKAAAALDLIQGRSEGQFEPQGFATRAEAAQVLYRLLSK